jgi:hypothetical protein
MARLFNAVGLLVATSENLGSGTCSSCWQPGDDNSLLAHGSPAPKLFFLMADGLDVVAVGILHEPAVVVRAVVGPEAGLAIVLAASG